MDRVGILVITSGGMSKKVWTEKLSPFDGILPIQVTTILLIVSVIPFY